MALNTNKNNPLVSKIRADNVFGGGVQDNMRASMNSTFANLRSSIPGYGPAEPQAAENPFAVGMGGNNAAPSPLNVATGNIFGGGISPSERAAATGASVPEQVAGVLSGLGDQGKVTQFQNAVKQAGFNLDPTGQLPEEYQGALAGAQNIYNSIFGTPGEARPPVGQQTFAPTGLRQRALAAGGAVIPGQGDVMVRAMPNAQGGTRFDLGQIYPGTGDQPAPTPSESNVQGLSRLPSPVQPSTYEKNAASFKNNLVSQQMKAGLMKSIPLGYMLDPNKPSGIMPIPGGPAEIELRKAQQEEARKLEAYQARLESVQQGAQNVIANIDDVLAGANKFTVGPGGKILGVLWGSDAYDLKGAVDTIKANIGFDRLQQMRDQSPTGGALGSLAVKELDALQNSLANLDTAQSEKTFKKHLGDVRAHYERFLQAESGRAPDAVATQSTPATPAAIPTFTPEKQKRLEELRAKLGKK